jgi:tRNA(fMet)-specific endonuclease VapC
LVLSTPVFLLDTNIVTYIVDGRSAAARDIMEDAIVHSIIAVSSITQAEILFGLERKPAATRLRTALTNFFRSVQILPWTTYTAETYAQFRVQLAKSGKTLSTADMLIAAHTAEWNATLVTHDKAFLHATPLIKVVDWATDLRTIQP